MKKILWELVIILVLAVAVALLVIALMGGDSESAQTTEPTTTPQETEEPTVPEETQAPTKPEDTVPEITWMTFPADRTITAQQYFVYDVYADEFVVISGPEDEKIYPASVTKLFTCLTALRHLKPEQTLTVGDELDLVVAGSSVAGLQKGDQLTVSQLVKAMLLPSGNDAAYVLAYNVGKKLSGSTDVDTCITAFMKAMNDRASNLGMKGTNFANPDGIHRENHYMTFRDLAFLGRLAAQNETVVKNATLPKDDAMGWKNTNAIINPESEYYCPYAVGLKTGQTPYAGSCLLSAFDIGSKLYVVGVFGCPDSASRFCDTLQLFNQTLK